MVDPAPWAMAGFSSLEEGYPRRMGDLLRRSIARSLAPSRPDRPMPRAALAAGAFLPLLAALLLGPAVGGAWEGTPLASGTILFSSSPFASLASEVAGDLFTVQADGTGLVNLTQHPAVYRDPVWSPDGREIAFQSDCDGGWRLYRMTSDGATAAPIPGTGPLDFLAGWSPDGLSLLLVTLSEVNREVVLLRLADGERTNLTRDPGEDDSPVFSPDGRAILFVSDRVDRTPQLFRLDLATGALAQLTSLYRGAVDPTASPDGLLVAYAAERDALDNMDLCVMSSDGTSPRTIWSATGRVVPGGFSSDGAWIVAERSPSSSSDVSEAVLVPVDGLSSPIPLADPVAQGGQGTGFRPSGPSLAPIPLPEPVAVPLPRPLALVGATLIDGTGADPVPNAAIVLREGTIAAVGPREAVEVPADALVIDVSGMTLLPGLINTHVHDAYDARILEGWAQGGVTTVRDLGAWTGSSNELEVVYTLADATRDPSRYARLVGASPMLTTPGGYGYLGVASREEGEAEVARLLEAGADLIKIGIEDRLATRSWPLIPQDIAEGIVKAAHARGAWVSAHVSRASHVQMALDAGVDELGHMIYDEPPDGLIERVVAAGIV